jgi:hypothetical protein
MVLKEGTERAEFELNPTLLALYVFRIWREQRLNFCGEGPSVLSVPSCKIPCCWVV